MVCRKNAARVMQLPEGGVRSKSFSNCRSAATRCTFAALIRRKWVAAKPLCTTPRQGLTTPRPIPAPTEQPSPNRFSNGRRKAAGPLTANLPILLGHCADRSFASLMVISAHLTWRLPVC